MMININFLNVNFKMIFAAMLAAFMAILNRFYLLFLNKLCYNGFIIYLQYLFLNLFLRHILCDFR